jgi:hypothetical protein
MPLSEAEELKSFLANVRWKKFEKQSSREKSGDPGDRLISGDLREFARQHPAFDISRAFYVRTVNPAMEKIPGGGLEQFVQQLDAALGGEAIKHCAIVERPPNAAGTLQTLFIAEEAMNKLRGNEPAKAAG